MEETVKYEHIINQSAGFELDYEYEIMERHTESDGERFVNRGDVPEDPWNYFEVKHSAEKADAVAAAVSATLSDDYNTVSTEAVTLDGAGACNRIDASGIKAGKTPAGSLQTCFIIPAGDGCLVAEVHYTFESAEGFGARVFQILNKLSLIQG